MFNGSSRFRDNKHKIKNIGRVKKKTIIFIKNIFKTKNNSELISIFIIKIIRRLEGLVKINRITIRPKINSKKTSFFREISLACLIGFYYNRKLWLKYRKTNKK
jgi:hypothetical protein